MANESRSDVVALYSAGLRWPILPGRSRLQRLSAGIHAAKGAARLEHVQAGKSTPSYCLARQGLWARRDAGHYARLLPGGRRGFRAAAARRDRADEQCLVVRPCRSC